MTLLRVEGVHVELGGMSILRDITFEVAPGETFGIVGPNGAGKTTILNVVSGVVRPVRGQVLYKGESLANVRPHRIASRGIGRSLQSTHYFADLTALNLVALGGMRNTVLGALRYSEHRRTSRRDGTPGRAMEALRQLGVDEYAHRPLRELSSAVQKVVDLARAVLVGTDLLLLDEPTSGVSGQDRGIIGAALKQLRDMGRTIVLVDHDPEFVTTNCDRLMAMNFGEVLQVGDPHAVMASDEVRKSYLGEGGRA